MGKDMINKESSIPVLAIHWFICGGLPQYLHLPPHIDHLLLFPQSEMGKILWNFGAAQNSLISLALPCPALSPSCQWLYIYWSIYIYWKTSVSECVCGGVDRVYEAKVRELPLPVDQTSRPSFGLPFPCFFVVFALLLKSQQCRWFLMHIFTLYEIV